MRDLLFFIFYFSQPIFMHLVYHRMFEAGKIIFTVYVYSVMIMIVLVNVLFDIVLCIELKWMYNRKAVYTLEGTLSYFKYLLRNCGVKRRRRRRRRHLLKTIICVSRFINYSLIRTIAIEAVIFFRFSSFIFLITNTKSDYLTKRKDWGSNYDCLFEWMSQWY